MGMRINSSSTQSAAQGLDSSKIQQRQQTFKDMLSAIQSGDLSTAQKDYASLSNGKTNTDANSPLAQIGKALQSGDITAAQTALQTLQSNQASGQHGHHGHHHGGGSGSATSAAAPAPAPAGQGTLLNVSA